jgi:multidrug efflux pump subunit AcrB
MEQAKGAKSGFRVIIIFILFALVGLAVTPLLNIKLLPEESLQRVFLTFRLPGATPRVVESSVTSRLEGVVASLNGVADIESTSKMGLGEISIGLNQYADPEKFRVALSMAIRQTWKNFPQEATFPEISTSSPRTLNEAAILTYRVESESSEVDLGNYLTQSLIPHLHKVSGLKRVQIDGLYNIEAHIVIDRQKAKILNLSPSQIVGFIRSSQQTLELNNIAIAEPDGGKQYSIRFLLGKSNEIDLKQISIATRGGQIVTLDDIATYQLRRTNENQSFRVNGVDNVYLRLYADRRENHLKLAKSIRTALTEHIQQSQQGVKVHLVSDSTQFISSEIRSIVFRTLLTIILLMLATWAIYRDKKYLLIIAISLAINVCISFFVFYLYRLEVHFFAMAGITISLGMMIDNSIIVIDYLKKVGHKRILLPLLAANLTTIGALLSISVFSEQLQSYWHQFTAVVVFCLSISFISALFLIPALVSKIGLRTTPVKNRLGSRTTVRINNLYYRYIVWSSRRKWLIITVFILAFGTPFFMLPSKLKGDSSFAFAYNKLFTNKHFASNVRPIIDKYTGGTLRAFITKTLSSYTNRFPQEKKLRIYGISHKEYSGLHISRQVRQLENFLLGVDGIKYLQVEVSPYKRTNISISFNESSHPSLPYNLLDEVSSYLQKYGGGIDWSLSYDGVNSQITHGINRNHTWGYNLYGYNFDELLHYAVSECDSLAKNPRVVAPKLKSRFSFFGNSGEEKQSQFSFNPDIPLETREKVVSKARELVAAPFPLGVYDKQGVALTHYIGQNIEADSYYKLFNIHWHYGQRNARLNTMGKITKIDVPLEIVRKNQQYQLHVNFGYMGSGELAVAFEKEQVSRFSSQCAPGFSASSKINNESDQKPNLLGIAALIVVIIFFITSILFESFRQSLWVISMIPFSYIGVFITFSTFDIQFDQGGYAAFILLGGITVNAALYLLNTFNNTPKGKSIFKQYIKAWNTMITPIFLTILSTILGFLPFLFKGSEVFWRALASGVIGGLIFSLVVIILLLPLSLKKP